VERVILWRRAFPERVALGSLSTELGEVNTCLKAWIHKCHMCQAVI